MRQILNDLKKYHYFLKELVRRDFQKKYYQSVLGILWTVLNPLLMMCIITIVFSTLFHKSIEYFPVYYLSGTLIFGLNREASSQALHAVTGNAALIKKIYVPPYFFCLSKVLLALLNFLFSLVPLLLVMLVTHVPIPWTIVLIPLPVILTLIFTAGLSLALSAAAVYFRDLEHLYGLVTMAWMYLTPLFYPVSIIPERWRLLWMLNPMVYYVEMFRNMIYQGRLPAPDIMVCACAFSLISFLIGTLLFNRLKRNFFLHF